MTRQRILIAEDNEGIRRLLCELCRTFGHEVDAVEHGLSAVEAVREGAYDLVLMDCQMPVMGGLEAARRIRTEAVDQRRVVIVAVTGDGDRDECLAAGMDDFLTKPVRAAPLRATLARWLGDAVDAVESLSPRSETSARRTSQTPP